MKTKIIWNVHHFNPMPLNNNNKNHFWLWQPSFLNNTSSFLTIMIWILKALSMKTLWIMKNVKTISTDLLLIYLNMQQWLLTKNLSTLKESVLHMPIILEVKQIEKRGRIQRKRLHSKRMRNLYSSTSMKPQRR